MSNNETRIIPEGSLKLNEGFSNHVAQAYAWDRCPKNPQCACFAIATGFGGAVIPCEHFSDDGKESRCSYVKPE